MTFTIRRKHMLSQPGTRTHRKWTFARFQERFRSNPSLFDHYWNHIPSDLSDDGKDQSRFQREGYASTYGDLSLPGFQTLLEQYLHHQSRPHAHKKKKIFYDLGSGLGKPTLLAALLVPYLFLAKGIELSTTRHEGAMQVYQQMVNQCPSLSKKVRFLQGDILRSHFHYGDADMIWISSLCFSDQIINRLVTKLNRELQEGTHVFSSKPLHGLSHSFYQQFLVEMSWTKESNMNHYIFHRNK